MSSPSDPQQPLEPVGSRQSSTQEIPVVQPGGATTRRPPHPDAVAPAAVPMDAPQPTGPVDFVPGLPGVGTPPVPPSAGSHPPVHPSPVQQMQTDVVPPVWPDTLESHHDEPARPPKERRGRGPRDRATALGLGLAVLSLVLLELGLALDFGVESYWSTLLLWSAFATVCGLLGVLAFAASYPAGGRVRSGAMWRIAAGGLVGLAVFWLLVVLPVVASDRGFLLTAALGALGAALWIAPGRRA